MGTHAVKKEEILYFSKTSESPRVKFSLPNTTAQIFKCYGYINNSSIQTVSEAISFFLRIIEGVKVAINSKDFELVTRAIFQRLREQFDFGRVEGSHYYTARDSGVKRQVDVTAYSLDEKRTIIECKLHKRRVGIKYIDAFHTVIHTDIGADGGIIVSAHDFTKGAQRSAQAKKIALATLNEDATEYDFILKIDDLIFGGVSRDLMMRCGIADPE
jgi:predicted helicase